MRRAKSACGSATVRSGSRTEVEIPYDAGY